MARAFSAEVIDDEFNRTIDKIIRQSSRDARTVVNSQAYHFAIRSGKATRKASPEKIEEELGRITAIRLDTGKAKKVWGSRSLAFAIVMSRIIKKGGKDALSLFSEKEIRDKANRLVRARKKTSKFLSSGWIPAIRRIKSTIFGRDRGRTRATQKDLGRQRGRPKGMARPASRKLFGEVMAIVENSATKGSQRALAILKKGAQQGMIESIADMRRHMREKMQKIERKHNGRRGGALPLP